MILNNSNQRQSVAQLGLKNVSKLGCFLKFIPYSWNKTLEKLVPVGKIGKRAFTFHTYCNYLTALNAVFRLVQSFYDGTFSFMTAMWYIPILSVIAGFSTICHHQQEVMQFTNMLNNPKNIWKTNQNRPGKFFSWMKTITGSIISVIYLFGFKFRLAYSKADTRRQEKKSLSAHMLFNILLLCIMPWFHLLIYYSNPCASFVTASVLIKCKSQVDTSPSFLERIPVLLIDFYYVCKWQYGKWTMRTYFPNIEGFSYLLTS